MAEREESALLLHARNAHRFVASAFAEANVQGADALAGAPTAVALGAVHEIDAFLLRAILAVRFEAFHVIGIVTRASPADFVPTREVAHLAVDFVAVGTVAKDQLILRVFAPATHEIVTRVARRALSFGNADRAEHLSAVLADFHLRSGRVTVAVIVLVAVATPEVKAGSVFGEVQKPNLFVNPLQHKAVALHRFAENFLLAYRETLLESAYVPIPRVTYAAPGEAQTSKTLLFRTSLHADETHELTNIGNVYAGAVREFEAFERGELRGDTFASSRFVLSFRLVVRVCFAGEKVSNERKGGVSDLEVLDVAAVAEEALEALVRESLTELAVEHEVAGTPGTLGRDGVLPDLRHAREREAVSGAGDLLEDGRGDALVHVKGGLVLVRLGLDLGLGFSPGLGLLGVGAAGAW
jgi:hypothetical protein